MSNKKNILFVRVDDIIQQIAMGDLLARTHDKVGNVFNVSSEDIAGPERIPEGQYTYLYSFSQHQRGLNVEGGTVIDAELLEALADDEPIILKMIERAHFKENRFRYYDLRTHLYYTHLAYWLNFLKEKSIDHVIFGNVPHDGYDYIIYALAKHLKLKIDMFYQLQITDTYIHATRVEDLFSPIKEALVTISSEVEVDELSDRMKDEYQVRTKESDPHYMKPPARHGRLVDVALEFLRTNIILTERRRMIRREILSPIKQYTSSADLDKKFIYFGLHVQPELTTNALGGRYVNQFLAAQLIARCLPEGWKLYVKEHPRMLKTRDPSGRFREFYKMISELENVVLVPPELNTFELIEKSEAVATITGTLGWEAVFTGKPVLVFGNAFYQYCYGVFPVKTEAQMREALESVASTEWDEEKGRCEARRYLKAIEKTTIEGVVNTTFLAVSLDKKQKTHVKRFEAALEQVVFS